MAGETSKLHIVMFPWLAFGHIIPYFELSKFIARKGHKISFVSTPGNIKRLPELPPNLSSSITFVEIPLSRVDLLPENAEATIDIKNEDVPLLKKAYDGLETELTRFLEDSASDWIIYDFSPHWLPPVAARLGISRAFFLIINAWFLAFLGSSEDMINGTDERKTAEDFMVRPKWVDFETKVAYRRFEAEWIVAAAGQNVSGISDVQRSGLVISGSEVLLVRHCFEFEPQWLRLVEEIHGKRVIPLGLMPPPPPDMGPAEEDEKWVLINSWLGSKNKGSVIYVALGSEVTPSQDQLNELALGLELSGVPFFWVLRKPSGSDESYPVSLSDGFEERVKGRGIVWRAWAPQVKVLSHDSVGGFLTHCGWSSIIEGLMFGRPLITLPFLVDQGLNSRVIVQNELGFEVPRNEIDGSYTRDSVADSVKLVLRENEGEKLREKAKQMSKIFNDRELHNRYLDNSVAFLENYRYMNKIIK